MKTQILPNKMIRQKKNPPVKIYQYLLYLYEQKSKYENSQIESPLANNR